MMRNIEELPNIYMITGNIETNKCDFLDRIRKRLSDGIKLIQLRIKGVTETYYIDMASEVADLCEEHNCHLILNHSLENIPDIKFKGIHLTSDRLMNCHAIHDQIRQDYWLSAACHNLEELNKAQSLKLDFAILTPIEQSNFAPTAPYLGWETATTLRKSVSIPLYAAGGMSKEHISYVKQRGFYGIAALGALWDD